MEMIKKKMEKEDGRYIIFYEFKEEDVLNIKGNQNKVTGNNITNEKIADNDQ